MQYSEGFLLDGRYSLKQYVGSGSFGEVWLARDCETNVDVAVKIYVSMDNQGLEEFRKEFQLSFDLNHTNLLHASYLGVNSDDSRPYLVMPFCPEGSVTKYAGKMDEKTLWRFVRDVASGLAYLHSQTPEILHQDIKPDNILIMKNNDFVISDFGISKQLKQTLRRSARVADTAGAISYMGPERYGSNPIAVKSTDIWALGVSIFELATGELPFCGQGGIMLKNGADMPELPQNFSRHLDYVVTSCLSLETWDRPTAAQLVKYANAMLNDEEPAPFGNKELSKAEVKEDNDGRKTVRKIDIENSPVFKRTVRESTDKLNSKTVMEGSASKGTQMESSLSNDGGSGKHNKFLISFLAVILILVVASIVIVHNKNVKEQERIESIKTMNNKIVWQIKSEIEDAHRNKDIADDISREGRETEYMTAYRHILNIEELEKRINNEVPCEIPPFSDIKQAVRDSLFQIVALKREQESFFRAEKDTIIANTFRSEAQEIENLIQ